ncbi:unnamed protein product [Closterium sp. NIES-54]
MSRPIPFHHVPSRHVRTCHVSFLSHPVPSCPSGPVPSRPSRPDRPVRPVPSRPVPSRPVPSHLVPPRPLMSHQPLPPFPSRPDDLVFATADTEALTLVKSELHKRHTCIDLGELRSYLGLQITRD